MGRPKLPPKLKRTVLALKLTAGERALLQRVAEAMSREMAMAPHLFGPGLGGKVLKMGAAIRLLVEREGARLGVQVPATEEEVSGG
jgi:hypothetical protein